MSEEALQIAEKRREVKGKGEKEGYTPLNADSQEEEIQKTKWLSEEALQIAVKRREAKGKEKRKDTPI